MPSGDIVSFLVLASNANALSFCFRFDLIHGKSTFALDHVQMMDRSQRVAGFLVLCPRMGTGLVHSAKRDHADNIERGGGFLVTNQA